VRHGLARSNDRVCPVPSCVSALRTTIEALKGALDGEKQRLAEIRAERDRLAARRSWWPFSRVGS